MKFLLCALLALLGSHAALAAQPSSASSDQAALVQGNNAFAIDLYGQLRQQPGDLFFSPASISTAFAMAYAGAHGQTATEMAAALHFMLPPDRLHPAMGALLASLNATHTGYELHVADALWAENGEAFLPDFLSVTKADYGAGFHPVDFKADPNGVRATINQWVEQQTANKITDLLGPGSVSADTRMVLTNAIYFKGDWEAPFRPDLTEDEDFHLSATKTVKAPLMYRSGNYNYFDGGTFQALELPYTGEALSMIVFLPKDVAGLPALEQSFTAANAQKWLSQLRYTKKIHVTFPKFKMTEQFELNDALTALGMKQAFQKSSADFSGMTGGRDLWISAAVHKAYISVDEKGTEAAAATGIIMGATARPDEPPPIYFTANHPFLFLIRDNKSGGILFMGRVTDPTK
jgi:serpin B